MNIEEISQHLHTQDNRATADPLFVVRQQERIYGIDPQWDCSDGFVYLFEGETYSDADELALHGLTTGDCEEAHYVNIREIVTACLTEQGAKDYIACNGHNLSGEPDIYALSCYRNEEMLAIRRMLMERKAKERGQS